METLKIFFAGLGAAGIIGALVGVSLLIGAIVNSMIVLFAGPLIDGLIARWEARKLKAT